MRNLITGGAGFIGSHLAETLLDRGDEVTILDDLSTGSIANIEGLKDRPGFRYVVGGVAEERLLAELIDASDVVYHLAAAVGVRLIVERPVHTIETNIGGTELVLKHAAKKGRRVLIASTSEVYGKSPKVPFSEEDDMVLGPTTKARWSYACSKAIDEFLALSYHRERGLPTTVFRLFNTVGPRQVGQYGMVIPRFVDQALAGGPITVYGDGEQSRCFCDVADVIPAIVSLADCEQAVGQVFNVGSDEEVTINQLAERIRDKVDAEVAIHHVPYEVAYEKGFEDMRRRVPDVSKIAALTGWERSHTLDQILDRVIAWRRANPPRGAGAGESKRLAALGPVDVAAPRAREGSGDP